MSLIALRARLSSLGLCGCQSGRVAAPGSASQSATPRLRRLLPVATSVIAAAILVAYHLVLLGQRLADLSLFQPAVALRWLITVALLFALRRMHASGVPLVCGRRALAFWLLVLLLHVSFLGPLSEKAITSADSQTNLGLALILPAAAPLVLLSTIALVAWLAARRRATGSPPRRPLASPTVWVEHPSRGGWLPSLASRPPPVHS